MAHFKMPPHPSAKPQSWANLRPSVTGYHGQYPGGPGTRSGSRQTVRSSLLREAGNSPSNGSLGLQSSSRGPRGADSHPWWSRVHTMDHDNEITLCGQDQLCE